MWGKGVVVIKKYILRKIHKYDFTDYRLQRLNVKICNIIKFKLLCQLLFLRNLSVQSHFFCVFWFILFLFSLIRMKETSNRYILIDKIIDEDKCLPTIGKFQWSDWLLFLFAKILRMLLNNLGLRTINTIGSKMICRDATLNFIAINEVTLMEDILHYNYNEIQ